MKKPKMVSIVISNYNARDALNECLVSLMELNYPSYEVIVVDAGSSDGSPEMVKRIFPSVRLIKRERMGIGEALNCGISQARGELIVFDLNSDDVVDRDWLNPLVRVLCRTDDIGIVCGKRYQYGTSKILDSIGGKIDYLTGDTPALAHGKIDSKEYNVIREVDYVGVIMTKRDVINTVGKVDQEYYLYFEDTDYCIRARKAGYKIVYVPSAILWHRGSTTIGKFSPRSYYYIRRNQIRFVIKNFPLRFMFPALFNCMIIRTLADALMTIPFIGKSTCALFPRFRGYVQNFGDPRLVLIQNDAILWNLRNIRRTLSERYRVP